MILIKKKNNNNLNSVGGHSNTTMIPCVFPSVQEIMSLFVTGKTMEWKVLHQILQKCVVDLNMYINIYVP